MIPALISSPALTGEILPPGATVRVIGRTHPLNGSRIERYLDAGMTIEELIEEALADRPDFLQRHEMIVHIDGNPIDTVNFRRVRAKPGTTVTFLPRLQGGNILRSVLTVVVAVAALVFAAPTGGLSIAAAMGITGTAATVAGALVGAGILPAGKMALNVQFSDT